MEQHPAALVQMTVWHLSVLLPESSSTVYISGLSHKRAQPKMLVQVLIYIHSIVPLQYCCCLQWDVCVPDVEEILSSMNSVISMIDDAKEPAGTRRMAL